MKGLIKIACLLAIFAGLTAFSWHSNTAKVSVKWYTWEEAIAANKIEKRKLMIDVYTGWCGWCKVMDKKTFSDKAVAAYLNNNFYPIKLDAEQKEAIQYDQHTFEYMAGQGRRGVHALAYSLLDGQLSYPSIVFMDENIQRIMISKGFKGPDEFLEELEFTASDEYKNKSFKEFQKQNKKK